MEIAVHTPQLEFYLTPDKLSQAAETMRAVAHPTRLGVVQLLDQHASLTVGELSERLNVEQSLLSHHLSQMRLHGLLECRRDGKSIHYSLKMKQLLNLLNCVAHCHR